MGWHTPSTNIYPSGQGSVGVSSAEKSICGLGYKASAGKPCSVRKSNKGLRNTPVFCLGVGFVK